MKRANGPTAKPMSKPWEHLLRIYIYIYMVSIGTGPVDGDTVRPWRVSYLAVKKRKGSN